jgi:hypothetical protein
MGSSLFWDVMQRGLAVTYRRFGTKCRSLLGWSSSPRNVGKCQSTLRNIPEVQRSNLQLCRSLKLRNTITIFISQSWNIYKIVGLPSQGRDGWILKIAYLLRNCVGSNDWQCLYVRGRCSCECRTKQGRKTRSLWAASWYHWMWNAIDEMSHKPRSL